MVICDSCLQERTRFDCYSTFNYYYIYYIICLWTRINSIGVVLSYSSRVQNTEQHKS